jgi:succinoglycan biosynthesis protein ExoA
MTPADPRQPATDAARTLPPLGDAPTVAVVMPVRDAAATLEAAVEAARQPEVDEIVLAVGPSGDDTPAVAEALAARYPEIQVVANLSGRTPDALNAAIDASHGQVVVRVDAHAVLPSGYVARAVATLRETGAANVGGRQVPEADAGFARAAAAAMRSPVGAGGAAYRTGAVPGPVDTVYLGVFRREALDHVGGFASAFTRNQDAELNVRLRRAGYVVWFDPELAVTYRPRGDVASLARQYYEYGRWRRHTARTHPGSLAPRQLAAPTLVCGLAAAAVTSALLRDARPLVTAVGGYVGLLGAAGTKAAPAPSLAPATTLALGTMHLAWGVGFLQGPPPLPPRDAPDA